MKTRNIAFTYIFFGLFFLAFGIFLFGFANTAGGPGYYLKEPQELIFEISAAGLIIVIVSFLFLILTLHFFRDVLFGETSNIS